MSLKQTTSDNFVNPYHETSKGFTLAYKKIEGKYLIKIT